MTDQFIRNVSVEIEGGKTYTYSGERDGGADLRIAFETTQADRSTPNVARINIYNLAVKNTQLAFYRGKTVTLSAGYASGSSFVIFKGEIRQTRNLRENVTDTVLSILAADGSTPRNFAVVSKTLPANHTHYDRVMAVFEPMKALGLSLGHIDKAALTKTQFPRGLAMFGNVKDHLRQIGFATRTSWSIQNGRLQILSNDKTLPGGVIELNSNTGLVGMATQTIQGIEGQCLLNGNIVPGCVVRLNERSIQAAEYDLGYTSGANTNAMLDRYGISTDGTYKIFVVGHNGDTRGQAFFTSFIGVATSAPGQISPALAARGINTPDT